jgi:hypothetical protein
VLEFGTSRTWGMFDMSALSAPKQTFVGRSKFMAHALICRMHNSDPVAEVSRQGSQPRGCRDQREPDDEAMQVNPWCMRRPTE